MATQTWSSIQQTCAIACGEQVGNLGALFVDQFPQATSYAEDRICREIPFINNRSEIVQPGIINNGSFNINADDFRPSPSNNFVLAEQFGIFTSGASPSLVLYDRCTYEHLINTWPQIFASKPPTAPTPNANWPQLWTMLQDNSLWFGPPSDGSYTAFLVGLWQPTPISSDNPSTYLSTFYPDLLEAGIMVFLAGALRRNFGAQADEPRMAMSWETQFQELLAPAKDEEMRRRGMRPDVPAQRPPQQGAPA